MSKSVMPLKFAYRHRTARAASSAHKVGRVAPRAQAVGTLHHTGDPSSPQIEGLNRLPEDCPSHQARAKGAQKAQAGAFAFIRVHSRSFSAASILVLAAVASQAAPLPGTEPLEETGDLAAKMVDGIHTWLDREGAAAVENRRAAWVKAAVAGGETWTGFLADRRREVQRLMAFDPPSAPKMQAFTHLPLTPGESAALREEAAWGNLRTGVVAEKVQWPVNQSFSGEGWRLRPPQNTDPRAVIVVLTDAQSATALATGLLPGPDVRTAWPWRLARMGADVLVVPTVSRAVPAAIEGAARTPVIPGREMLWRAFSEVGRTLPGGEWAKAAAAVRTISAPAGSKLGVVGIGEGGWIALLAGAADSRCHAVLSSGAFASSGAMWQQPIDRSLWRADLIGGSAELAALIAPRKLILDLSTGSFPRYEAPPPPAAPGTLAPPDLAAAEVELARATKWSGSPVAGSTDPEASLRSFIGSMGLDPALDPGAPTAASDPDKGQLAACEDLRPQAFSGLLEESQRLMRESQRQRQNWWKDADRSSAEAFASSATRYRDDFWKNVLGRIPAELSPARPRSRLVYETPALRGWEVTLDVLPEVFAFGTLLVPKDLKPGEKRPCVVCQHGLEGRPKDVADPASNHPAYHAYAARLAERGFIVFAPQNPYIGQTHFRQICRKAWPLGLSLWSFILPQHQQILHWLGQQPGVDPSRIAFYGLSYGGKSAMRLPAMLDGYCLSICSADYNEWVWKTCDVRAPYSYLHTNEYDMVEWNLANTCNYAELSWLIFPRPFMVERGHDDGVSSDEWVAYEFARTYRQYSKLGLAERAEIEFFNGPHTINGKGTFRFLDRWLKK